MDTLKNRAKDLVIAAGCCLLILAGSAVFIVAFGKTIEMLVA
jgi:hypothetical protein